MHRAWLFLLPLLVGADWFPIELIADPAARSVVLPSRPAACYAMTATGTCDADPPEESPLSNSVCRPAGAVTLYWAAPTKCADQSPLASVSLWTIYTDTFPPSPRPAAPRLVTLTVDVPDLPGDEMAFRLAGASLSTSLLVTSKETSPKVWFDDSGLRMFVYGSSSDVVHKYDLTQPWQLATASFSQTHTMGGASNGRNPIGLYWQPNGEAFFISTSFTDRVIKYTVSSAWDLTSTVTESQLFSVAGQTALPAGVALSPDGTRMFVVGNDATDRVYSYTLGTPWSLATASYDTVSFSVASQETGTTGFSVTPDGLSMYVCGPTGAVYRYTLSTAWDLSTAAYASDSFSPSSSPYGCFVNPGGNRLYTTDDAANDYVYEHILPSAMAYDPRKRQLEQLVLH